MEVVVLEYQMSWEEFRRGLFLAVPTKAKVFPVCFVLAFLFFGGVSGDSFWYYYGVGFALFFSLSLFVLRPRRFWRAAVGIQEPRAVTVSREGIESNSRSLDIRLEWSRFAKVRESNEFFYLTPRRRGGGFLILKRGLKSELDERNLRLLLDTFVSPTSSSMAPENPTSPS